MKRILCIALALILLTGCNAQVEQPTVTTTQQPTTETVSTTVPSEQPGITVAVSDTACSEAVWQAVCQAFTARTGLRVTLTPESAGADVVHLTDEQTQEQIKTGSLMDLTDLLTRTIPGESVTVAEKLIPGIVETGAMCPMGDGKVYLMPLSYISCGLCYNQTLFNEKGWTVPTTWDEMWALAEAAKAEGISLFTYREAEDLEHFFYTLTYAVGGALFFNSAARYTEGVWQTEDGTAFAQLLAKLASYTHPSTPAQANAVDSWKNVELWLQNQALFLAADEALVSQMNGLEMAEGFMLGVTAVPGIQGTSYAYMKAERVFIPADASNPEWAEQFIAFLYSDEVSAIFAQEGLTLPILDGDDDLWHSLFDAGAKAAMGEFADYSAVAGVGSVRQVFLEPISQLVNGTITWREWVRDVENAGLEIRDNITQ